MAHIRNAVQQAGVLSAPFGPSIMEVRVEAGQAMPLAAALQAELTQNQLTDTKSL